MENRCMEDVFLKVDQILKNPSSYYAHKDGRKEDWETLEEHTALCQKYFARIYKDKKIDEQIRFLEAEYLDGAGKETEGLIREMLCNIVTFHDVGKLNPNFQRNVMLRKEIGKNPAYRAARNEHSILSAVLYIDYYDRKIQEAGSKAEKKLCMIMLCNACAIARHHSGLLPLKNFLESLCDGNYREIPGIFQQCCAQVCTEPFTLHKSRLEKYKKLLENIRKVQTAQQGIRLYFYGKLAYSMLVASDYYATSEFMSGIKTEEAYGINHLACFEEVLRQTEINQFIRSYESTAYPMNTEQLKQNKQINVLRNEIFLDAERQLIKEWGKNIFYLEAPTGSGKSNIAMNLSMRLAEKDKNLKKIYYVYPFNTLIEQNQEIMRKIFEGHPEMLEEIAVINSVTQIRCVKDGRKRDALEEKNDYYERALLNRQFLNYSMILTTHVSFFDILFGDSKESVFAFHQLVGSVIILDEIQSYKNTIWGEIITFLTELTSFLHMKVIIMSATLPDLEILKEKPGQAVYLITDRRKYFEHPCFKERVEISDELLREAVTMEALYRHVRSNCGRQKKILIEFITKSHAEEFYRMFQEDEALEEKIFCMTGDDSIFERKKIINEIKKKDNPVILISTQVIEAGIDIDMEIGYKNISKMDSEEQFLGRINRSYGKDGAGITYFFRIDEPGKVYAKDIRVNSGLLITRQEIWEMLLKKNFVDYYRKVLEIWNRNYADRVRENFFAEQVNQLEFQQIKEHMKLIDEERLSVSVYLGRVITDEESGRVIDGNKLWGEYRDLLRNDSMRYAEKKVRLSEVMSMMNCFIYQLSQPRIEVSYDEQIGELFYIKEGEKYFRNGRLNRAMLQGQLGDGIDFI